MQALTLHSYLSPLFQVPQSLSTESFRPKLRINFHFHMYPTPCLAIPCSCHVAAPFDACSALAAELLGGWADILSGPWVNHDLDHMVLLLVEDLVCLRRLGQRAPVGDHLYSHSESRTTMLLRHIAGPSCKKASMRSLGKILRARVLNVVLVRIRGWLLSTNACGS